MAGKTVSQLFDEVDQSLLEDSNSFTVELISPIDEISVLPEVEVTNPYEFDFSRLVPGQVVMDIDRFVEVASQLIEWAQRKEGIDENKFVKLTCEYGEANFEFWKSGQEVITWKIVSREPALMDPKGNSRPQRSAIDSYELRDPRMPNKKIAVKTRPLDHIIEFTVYSKNANIANKRAIWLERLFITHSWVFKVQGADRFFFDRRGTDNYRTTGTQPLYERPLRFRVRLFEFEIICYPTIRHFNVSLAALSQK